MLFVPFVMTFEMIPHLEQWLLKGQNEHYLAFPVRILFLPLHLFICVCMYVRVHVHIHHSTYVQKIRGQLTGVHCPFHHVSLRDQTQVCQQVPLSTELLLPALVFPYTSTEIGMLHACVCMCACMCVLVCTFLVGCTHLCTYRARDQPQMLFLRSYPLVF